MSEPGQLIDGNAVARGIRARLAEHLDSAAPVTLATVLVGEDPASQLYISRKIKEAGEAGIISRHQALPTDIAQDDLVETIRILACDSSVHGILVQMPLPSALDAAEVLSAIPPEKDVDGLTETNLGRLAAGLPGLRPCTPFGVMELLRHYRIATSGASALVIGRSRLVGIPMALMLAEKGVDATVSVAHSRTRDLQQLARESDILVAATGSPGMVTADFVKPGAAVFDVGVSRVDGKIQGDVCFEEVREVAGFVTPMPGGTGPMTVACLLLNTVRAAAMQGVVAALP